jgi:mannosyltransferase
MTMKLMNASKMRCTMAGVILLAALLRLPYLGRESLWYDESISVAIAHLNWGDLWKVVSRYEANAALYWGLLHVWVNFGDTEFVVRSLSAVAGVLTVPVIYALGRSLFGTKVAVIGAVLLAANTFHIRYSQEARAYSLVVLLATLSSLFFARAVQNQSRNEWVGYILTSTLAVYTHFFAVLVLGAQWASLVFLRPQDVNWRRLLVSISVIGFLLLPLAVFVLTRDTGQIAWVSKPTIYDIYGLFNSFAGGGRLLVLAYFIACFTAFLLAVRTWAHSKVSFDTWHYGFLLSWFFIPVLAAWAISLLKPIFVDRYLIVSLPALVLLGAVGVSQVRQRWILAASLAALLILSVRKVPWRTQLEKEDWRAATSYVVSRASPRDGIVFCQRHARLGFDYYARRLGTTSQTYEVAFPDSSDLAEAARVDPDDNLLASLPQQYDQVWLLLRFNDHDPVLQPRDRSIETILAGEYLDVTEKKFKGVLVLQYSKGAR